MGHQIFFKYIFFFLSENWGCRAWRKITIFRCFFPLKVVSCYKFWETFFPLILNYLILFYYFLTLISNILFSLKPIRNLINSVLLEHKRNVLKLIYSVAENSLWKKQLLTLKLRGNFYNICVYLFILNFGFSSWLFVKNTIQVLCNEINRNYTKKFIKLSCKLYFS